ncbi:MAG: TRAP transporter small permease [Mesorhizobium sp.]|nr:TRAP transporter small permease [Mesorhizobium sp.]
MNLTILIRMLARWLAILGGVVLVMITVMIVVSITGRAFIWAGLKPVHGDFELVEAGTAFAVFSFLPWCQLNRGHATVDLFTNYLPASANRVIDLVSEILMALVTILIAWRLWVGMFDKIENGEISFILQMPLWWGFAVCAAATVVGVIVSLYMVAVRVGEVALGRSLLDAGQGAVH